MESNEEEMIYASFNQDASCFAVGTEKGFKIFNTIPFKENIDRSKINKFLRFKLLMVG